MDKKMAISGMAGGVLNGTNAVQNRIERVLEHLRGVHPKNGEGVDGIHTPSVVELLGGALTNIDHLHAQLTELEQVVGIGDGDDGAVKSSAPVLKRSVRKG